MVASQWRQRVLGWFTAIGGSALILAGFAVSAPDTLGWLRNPTTGAGAVLAFALWVVLAVAGRMTQRRLSGQSDRADPAVAPA